MESSENGLPFGAIATAPAFTARAASGMSCVTTIAPSCGALGDPVVGRIHAGGDDHAFDQRITRNRDRAVADDKDLQPVPFGDAIDFLLHRAGVGVDVDRDRGRPMSSRASLRSKCAGLGPRMQTFAAEGGA